MSEANKMEKVTIENDDMDVVKEESKIYSEKIFLDTLNVTYGDELLLNELPWYFLYYGNLNCLRNFLGILPLKVRDFKLWQPSYKVKKEKGRNIIETRRLLFPGYAFFKTSNLYDVDCFIQDYFKDFYFYFLKKGNEFATLSKEEEEWILRLEEIWYKIVEEHSTFKKGDLVRLKDSRWGELIGKVVNVNESKRTAEVEFVFFRTRTLLFTVDLDTLENLTPPEELLENFLNE
jgi:transcription antitermination factor NusG